MKSFECLTADRPLPKTGSLDAGLPFRIRGKIASYFLLIKPKTSLLVTMTGLSALVLEGSLLHDLPRFAGVLLGIFLAAGAANAFNQFWDRDIDAIMARTRAKRPIPSGRVSPFGSLVFVSISGTLAVLLLNTAGNTVSAALGVGSILIYVWYTVLLKRRTSLNIVIGGAAGAAAPLIAWAAGAEGLGIVPLLMSLIIFLWTPPHFWALALHAKQEYAMAGIPMLPVVAGEKHTRIQITAYTVALLSATAYLGIRADLGTVFFIGTAMFGLYLFNSVIQLWRRRTNASARELFCCSIVYLTAVYSLMIVSSW